MHYAVVHHSAVESKVI